MAAVSPGSSSVERRVLVLPARAEDGELICKPLSQADIECQAFLDLDELVAQLELGAGALLLWEEAIQQGSYGRLAEYVSRQAAWSDLPVLILTRHGADSAVIRQTVELLSNCILLERPIRVAALVTAVRAALRARERQYQIRAHLAERERVTQTLAEADRRKDEFVATLAHELRNPLAPITNSVHLLRLLSAPDTESRHLTEILERQVAHMVRLVNDLMELSRITRGLLVLHRERTDLATVIRNAVEASRPLIEAGAHTLTVSLPGAPLSLDADPIRLAQVFANLLNNAAKFSDRGSEIVLSAAPRDRSAEIRVRDRGLGISPEMLPRVFEMFTQADRAGTRAQSGLGIGLTLVRSLVEMHGGRVEAHSQGLGMGSEFIVLLPLAERASEPPAPASVDLEKPVLRGLRVLVVDDSRDGADSLAVLLRHLGAEVRVANDGPTALDLLREFGPEAAIVDIGMPGITGFEVARRIRMRPEHAGITLIALTGWGQEADRSRTRSAGFDHHLIKPADLESLRHLLTSLVPARR